MYGLMFPLRVQVASDYGEPVIEDLPADELLPLFTDADLLGELVRRGVLEEQASVCEDSPFRLFTVRVEPVGSGEPTDIWGPNRDDVIRAVAEGLELYDRIVEAAAKEQE